MKRSILSMLVCGWIAFTAASGAAPALADSGSPVLDRISKAGELRVGTSGNQPPLSATTKDGNVIGLDADLARIIARAMGVKLTLVPLDFSELLPALEGGKVDMVLSGMTMTPRRNMRVAFVGPYFISGKAVLTKSKKLADVKDSDELNKSGITLAALEGSTSQDIVEKGLSKATLVTTKDYDAAVQKVIKGEVDALVADFPFCVVTTFRFPDENLQTLVAPFTFEPLGVAVPASDPLLVNWLDNFLLMTEGSGALMQLTERWFKDGAWIGTLK
jgi:polar amino acid transport system substrate-binding protein